MVKGLITTKTNKKVEGYDNMNHLYFSVPVDCEQVDEIKVTVKSRDQGWGGLDSYSWTEIGILDSEGKEKGSRLELYKNDVDARKRTNWQTHQKIITKNEPLSNALLSNIKKGDKVAIWLRSQYPGWSNHAKGGEIELLEKGSKDERQLLRKIVVKDWTDWNNTLKSKKANTTEIEFDGDELELDEKGELIIADYPNLEKIITTEKKGLENIIKIKIQNCPQLKELTVTNFTDNQELVIINCPNLEVLECGNNKLSKLVGVNECLNLTKLDCCDNQLTNLDISNCQQLKKLDCNGNKLTNLNLTSLEKLKYINCSDNQLSQLNLGQRGKLEKLYIRNNNFPAENPTWLSHSVNLKELDLSGNNFTSLEFTKKLTALEILNISQTQIATGLEFLPQSLKEITCEGEMKKELVLYNNDLLFWQEAHPELMEKAGKKPVILSYEKIKPEKVVTTPDYLKNIIKQKTADERNLNKENKFQPESNLSNLNYSHFILRDGRPFSWEREPITVNSKQLPLRLYNTQTREVKTNTELNLTDYAILSYCWGTDWEKKSKSYGQSYQTDLTKLGRKALNKVIKAWELINRQKNEKLLEKNPALSSQELAKSNLDYIWIDNFCINQSNSVEKGQEVAKQKQYYGNAAVTLVAIDNKIGEEINKENKYELVKHIIEQVVTSPWFTRAWTFQEGLLSKQTIFMFDDYLVDGRILAMAWNGLQQSYSSRLNTNPQIFVTPLGWSYGAQREQEVGLNFGQALLAVKHRQQTVPVDGFYAVLGLLIYGNKVKTNYKDKICSDCKTKETKDIVCEHLEKAEYPKYFTEDLEKALHEVAKKSIEQGHYGEIFSWIGPRNNKLHYWYMPQIQENGSTNVESLTNYQSKNMQATLQGVQLVGKRYVVEKVPEDRNGEILVTTKQNELSLRGSSETLERIKGGDSLVVFSEEQEGDYQLAILIPSTDDYPIDIVKFKLESGERLAPQELFIDMTKREIIFGTENIAHYHQLTKELAELELSLEKTEYKQKKQELASLLEWNKWKKIQQDFNQGLVQRWKDNNFTYEQVHVWSNAFKDYFNPQEINFYLWLRDNKKLTAEECASKQNLREQLIVEYGSPNKSKMYGGSGGGSFNDLITIWEAINWKKIDAIRISKFMIRFSSMIHNIQFTYQVKSKGKWHEVVGDHGIEWRNTQSQSISLVAGEDLVNVEGWTSDGLITGLSFQTSNSQTGSINTYGSYGKEKGEKFNLPIKYTPVFFGNSGYYIDAIGIQQLTQEQQLNASDWQELTAQIQVPSKTNN